MKAVEQFVHVVLSDYIFFWQVEICVFLSWGRILEAESVREVRLVLSPQVSN